MANAFVSTAGEVTSRLTDYIISARWSDLPANVRYEALRSFFNILGCTIGGARHAVVEIADNTLSEYAGAPHATVIGRGHMADALHACLINTLSSSIYSYDDTHAEAVVHPSGPVAAAVLALAEKRPTSGADFLLAFALGVEMTCRLSKAISVPPADGTVAWSQTGIAAGIGAAVAAAKLLRLDAARLQYAIGIALSQAAGFRVMHATMVSSLMPAQGGQTGLRAALLAERGFTASPVALEGKYGFLEVFAQQAHLPALVGGLGEQFEILRNTYKPYPCGNRDPSHHRCLPGVTARTCDRGGGGGHGAHQGFTWRNGVMRPPQSAERAAGARQSISLDCCHADPRHRAHPGVAGPDGAGSCNLCIPGQDRSRGR